MNDEFHQLFDDSWDGWLSNRFSGTIGGIEMETSETEKASLVYLEGAEYERKWRWVWIARIKFG